MTIYNTGNPVGATGSADPRDLNDNFKNLDILTTSKNKERQPDRLGALRKTWHGMESDFEVAQVAREQQYQQAILEYGNVPLGDYAEGVEVTGYNQTIRDCAGGTCVFYRAAVGTELPYKTTGLGMPEGGAFVDVGDATLRSQLAKSGGSSLVANSSKSYTSIAEMQAENGLVVGDLVDIVSALGVPHRQYSVASVSNGFDSKPLVNGLFSNTTSDSSDVVESLKTVRGVEQDSSYPLWGGDSELTNIQPLFKLGAVRVFRDGKSNYSYQYDLKSIIGTQVDYVFISNAGGDGDGSSPDSAISWKQFETKALAGEYTSRAIHIYLIDNIYYAESSVRTPVVVPNKRLVIESVSMGGMSWITNSKKLTWSYGSGLWSATTSEKIVSVCSLLDVDSNGVPVIYNEVGSLAAVNGKRRAFYYSASENKVYVKPFFFMPEDANFLLANRDEVSFNNLDVSDSLIIRNVGYFTKGLIHRSANQDAISIYEKCIFAGGANDSFAADSVGYRVFLLGCVGAWGSKDIFNYHSAGGSQGSAVAVEVNCKAYGAGVNKQAGYSGANITTNSNNASTAHDGQTVMRFGCEYWDCEGPVVADVNGCLSINYGVKSSGPASTTSGANTPYLFSKDSAPPYAPSVTVLVDCESGDGLGVVNSLVCNSNELLISNFKGSSKKLNVTSATIKELT